MKRKNQHLVAALVRAYESDRVQLSKLAKHRHKMTLTEEEIISNLFVCAFIGNDTTAIALPHPLVDLAASSDTQDWVAQEIRHYLREDDALQWVYETFLKLKPCLAVVVCEFSILFMKDTDISSDGAPSHQPFLRTAREADR